MHGLAKAQQAALRFNTEGMFCIVKGHSLAGMHFSAEVGYIIVQCSSKFYWPTLHIGRHSQSASFSSACSSTYTSIIVHASACPCRVHEPPAAQRQEADLAVAPAAAAIPGS